MTLNSPDKDVLENTLLPLMEFAVTNAFILHKFYRIEVGKKTTIESHFRDQLVLQIDKYGLPLPSVVVPPSMQYRVSHGS